MFIYDDVTLVQVRWVDAVAVLVEVLILILVLFMHASVVDMLQLPGGGRANTALSIPPLRGLGRQWPFLSFEVTRDT